MVTATLEWETNKDLDLYCFYVTTNGEIGKVYYKNLGSSKVSPYIVLTVIRKNQEKKQFVFIDQKL